VLGTIDGAVFAITVVRDLFTRCLETAGKPGQTRSAREWMTRARTQAGVVSEQLKTCTSQMDYARDAYRQELEKMRSIWSDVVLPRLQECAEDIDQNRWKPSPGDGGRAEQFQQTLGQLSIQLNALANRYAAEIDQQGDAALRDKLRRQTLQTRRDRLASVVQRLESAALRQVAQKADVLRYGFDSGVFSFSGQNWANVLSPNRREAEQHTDLTAPLGQIEQDSTGRTLAAVVMLTDGAHNVDSDPLKKAVAMARPPIYVVAIGNTRPARDVMLHHGQAPRSVFQNSLVVIEAMLDAQECAGEQLQVELLENGQVVDQQRVTVPTDTFFTPLVFKRKAERLGLNEYQVRVTPVADERTTENNLVSLQVEVTEGKIRVLLADQLPRWEFRYLRNLFKRDARIDFSSLQLDSPGAGGASGEATSLPRNLDAWNRYRVVILGDIGPDFLTPTHQEQLKDYVSLRGGTLVLIAGETAMPSAYVGGPLGSVLPVESAQNPLVENQVFHPVVTPEGQNTDVIQLADETGTSDQVWSEQVDIQRLSAYSLPKSTSHVWLAALPGTSESPAGGEMSVFLCWQKFGKGRVVYLAAPVTYRLRYRYGDRYHDRFWRQLLRWAVSSEIGSGSNTVRLITDKTRYQSGEDIPVTVRLSHPNGEAVSKAQVNVVARSEEQVRATVTAQEDRESPGVYRAALKGLPVGGITIHAEGPVIQDLLSEEQYKERVETQIVVEPPLSLELRNTRCNLSLLTQMAAATGGAVVPPTALPTALAMLDLSPEVTEEVRQQALWPRWTLLAVFLGSLGAEWVIRKLAGMA
jgi:hypothetical protein